MYGTIDIWEKGLEKSFGVKPAGRRDTLSQAFLKEAVEFIVRCRVEVSMRSRKCLKSVGKIGERMLLRHQRKEESFGRLIQPHTHAGKEMVLAILGFTTGLKKWLVNLKSVQFADLTTKRGFIIGLILVVCIGEI
jgi:hypothetical protein